MATPAKRVLDFDQVEDKPEAIKEVEVTPVEEIQVKKEVVGENHALKNTNSSF